MTAQSKQKLQEISNQAAFRKITVMQQSILLMSQELRKIGFKSDSNVIACLYEVSLELEAYKL